MAYSEVLTCRRMRGSAWVKHAKENAKEDAKLLLVGGWPKTSFKVFLAGYINSSEITLFPLQRKR